MADQTGRDWTLVRYEVLPRTRITGRRGAARPMIDHNGIGTPQAERAGGKTALPWQLRQAPEVSFPFFSWRRWSRPPTMNKVWLRGCVRHAARAPAEKEMETARSSSDDPPCGPSPVMSRVRVSPSC